MKRQDGVTIVELLIALAVIGIAFTALALTQVNSLRASARSRLATEAKAEATRVLETAMTNVLQAVVVPDTDGMADQDTDDVDNNGSDALSFYFIDYYWGCPNAVAGPRAIRNLDCSGTVTSTNDDISTAWSVRGESGVLGEGVLSVTVTATHVEGSHITMGNRVSCYDISPSPTSTAPEPCPEPTQAGAGR